MGDDPRSDPAEVVLASVDWHVVWVRIAHPDHVFFLALTRTVYIAVIAQVMGVLLGLAAALMRMSKLTPLRFMSGVYVWIFRGTPLLVQIFFIYYGANELLGFTLIPNSLNVGLFSLDGAIVGGILALGINEGAYMREIVRAGIDSIDKGQMEAAKSLGMRYGLAMRRIVLPQAARVIIPPLGNEFNNMLKNTSLLFAIGVYEMFADAEIGYSNSFQPVEYFLGVAFWYLVLTTVWTFIQAAIERRLAVSERGEELTFIERVQAAWNPVTAWARR
jgi:polar amino acid transport system permease protein